MARKSKNQKKRSKKLASAVSDSVEFSTAGEDRASVAVTVAWCLTILCAAASVVAATLVFLAAKLTLNGESPQVGVASDVLFVISAITGIGCVALMPLVYRIRPTPPPRLISVVAIILGGLWLAVGVMRANW